jgi:CBS-domain-containing membrane protein
MSFLSPWGEMIAIEEAPDTEIRHYMTAQPVSVEPTAPIAELAQKMIDAHLHRLLVAVQGCGPCGIVSSTDLLAALAREPARAAQRGARKRRKKSPAPK